MSRMKAFDKLTVSGYLEFPSWVSIIISTKISKALSQSWDHLILSGCKCHTSALIPTAMAQLQVPSLDLGQEILSQETNRGLSIGWASGGYFSVSCWSSELLFAVSSGCCRDPLLVKMLRINDCWVFSPKANIYIIPSKTQRAWQKRRKKDC